MRCLKLRNRFIFFSVKLIIFCLFFIQLQDLFSYTRDLELVTLKKEIDEKENELKLLFNAIRKKNNKYVIYRMDLRENTLRKSPNETKINRSEVYGPLDDDIYTLIGRKELINVNEKSLDGYTPLVVAIESNNNDLVKIFLENNADLRVKHPILNRTVLGTAAYYENLEAAELLLKKNPRLINIKSQYDGWNALQDATLKSNTEIVKLLLKYGANPMQKDNHGGDAMDMATDFGKGEIVKLFRDNIKSKRK